MTSRPQHLTPPSELFDGWGSDLLDLDAYRERVEYDNPLSPDLDTLFGLQRAQVTHIPFENLDLVLGRGIAVDVESIQDKLVRRGRGGYCYEVTGLLAAVLERAGFTFTGSLARVRMGTGQLRPTSHANLIVRFEDATRWLVDAGFGDRGILDPIQIVDGNEATQGGWRYRVDRVDEHDWILSTRHRGDWLDLYSFTLQPRYPNDFAVANHFTSTHARSPFTGRLMATAAGEHTRPSVVDTELTLLRADGDDEVTRLAPSELPDLLTKRIGIALSDAELADIVRTVDGYMG